MADRPLTDEQIMRRFNDWPDRAAGTGEPGQTLYEHLGMTPAEYSDWFRRTFTKGRDDV